VNERIKLPVLAQNRASSLGIAEFCGYSPQLSKRYNASGRSALQGSYFHAIQSGAPSETLRAMLTAEELEEVAEWYPVADLEWQGVKLRYADMEHELRIALDRCGGGYIPKEDEDPDALSIGHLDMAKVIELDNGIRIAFVGDIKRSEYTTSDGPKTLQLAFYGTAYALLHQCDGYVPAIWAAVEGTWDVGQYVDLLSAEGLIVYQRLVHAATNTEHATGAHCMGCWSRMHCEHHLLPAALAGSELAQFTEGNEVTTADAALRAAQLADAYTEIGKLLKERVKAFASRQPLIDSVSGKAYRRIECKGKRSGPSVKDLEAAGMTNLIREGSPYDMWKWVNP
jgi:hypothetical protein